MLSNNEKLDTDLVKLVSYLTFDGHLSKDLKSFYMPSKNKDTLSDFESAVYRKFELNGKLEIGNGRKDGKITKGLYFKIKQNSIRQFTKEISFNDRFKKSKLTLNIL